MYCHTNTHPTINGVLKSFIIGNTQNDKQKQTDNNYYKKRLLYRKSHTIHTIVGVQIA